MPLSDAGLVCRYNFDEAASGTGPTSVLDKSSNAYHLTEINYGSGNLAYTEIGGNRGLESISTTGTQRARRAISNTSDALRDALNGVTQATIELVLRVDAVNSSGSRFFGINGRSGQVGRFIVKATATSDAGSLVVGFNDTDYGNADVNLSSRCVLHIVLDTPQATAANRLRYSLNGGALAPVQSGSGPAQNEAITIGSNQDLVALNREFDGSFDRSFDGVLFYAAIYTGAFDATRISDHYDALIASDDPSGATVDQKVYRYFNDDGSESGSTAMAAQDTDVTVAPGGVFRIRFGIQATGDPTAKQFRLEYDNVGGSNWKQVP